MSSELPQAPQNLAPMKLSLLQAGQRIPYHTPLPKALRGRAHQRRYARDAPVLLAVRLSPEWAILSQRRRRDRRHPRQLFTQCEWWEPTARVRVTYAEPSVVELQHRLPMRPSA